MSALPPLGVDEAKTLREIATYLRPDAPADLVRRLNAMAERIEAEWITTGEAARLLGVSSRNTVKNWLQGGFFPGAIRTEGGHWRYLRAEVQAVRRAMDAVKRGPIAVGGMELPMVDESERVEGLD